MLQSRSKLFLIVMLYLYNQRNWLVQVNWMCREGSLPSSHVCSTQNWNQWVIPTLSDSISAGHVSFFLCWKLMNFSFFFVPGKHRLCTPTGLNTPLKAGTFRWVNIIVQISHIQLICFSWLTSVFALFCECYQRNLLKFGTLESLIEHYRTTGDLHADIIPLTDPLDKRQIPSGFHHGTTHTGTQSLCCDKVLIFEMAVLPHELLAEL